MSERARKVRPRADPRPAAPPAAPLPGWAGVATLFGAPLVSAAEHGSVDYLAAGAPFDGTTSSRPGAAEGPAAIRQASRVFAANLGSLGEHRMVDTRTGECFRYLRPRLADAGDLHVYPSDAARTCDSLASEVRQLACSGATLLLFGGDHSVSFPLFAGVAAARGGARGLGYVQVDHHFDFGRYSAIHGPVYHGSNARRISEVEGMAPTQMAFVGIGSTTRRDQLDELTGSGYQVISAATLRREGAAPALADAIGKIAKSCQGVYLSIDIDVLNAAEAPGTGGVTFGGLDAATLMDTLFCLRSLPLVAIDLVEVAPRYDPTGRTALLAAQIIFELIHRSPPDV